MTDERPAAPAACRECPFRRDVDPAICDRFGADPAAFVGQAAGPFLLPCHKGGGFAADACDPANRPCAGAAAYRANCGVAGLPPGIPVGPADPAAYFATPAEFLAHHRRIPLAEAAAGLEVLTVADMLFAELCRTGVRVVRPASQTVAEDAT